MRIRIALIGLLLSVPTLASALQLGPYAWMMDKGGCSAIPPYVIEFADMGVCVVREDVPGQLGRWGTMTCDFRQYGKGSTNFLVFSELRSCEAAYEMTWRNNFR